MSRFFVVFLIFFALIFASCDNQKAGTFAVKFSWAKDDAGKEVKPDVSTGEFFVTVRIYEWKEGVTFPGDIAANGKQLTQSDSAQMKATGTSIDFGDLSYGSRRFVVAEIRKGEELTNSVLFTGMSQLFDFKAGKHTEVNVEMSLTGLPGYDENGENTFKIWIFHKDSPAERVPESRVALRFTIRNANSIVIANDLNFEKGTAEIALADLKKIDETTYEYSPWDFTTGWEEIGDGSYTVFGKLKNNIGQMSEPKRADVFLDTTPPVPNITPFKDVAKPGDIIEVRFSFDEAIDTTTLELDWKGLEFELAENKSDKSFTYNYTINNKKSDLEIEYSFYLKATDLVGNKTDIVNLGKVRIDKTSPDLSFIAMFKNESEHGLSSNLYLKHGDVLRFEFEVNEEIAEIPQLKIGTYDIPCEKREKKLSFDCSLTIDKDVTYDVVADITLSLKDIAGNIYSRSIVSGAKIDTQIPQFIFRKNKDPQDYNATDTIVLTITANEPVSMIEIDGTELDNTLTSWNISGKNETGTHEVKLKAFDLAGNEQPGFTVGTYKVDADFPTALISAPTPDRISGTGSSVITVNGFSKPVQSVKLNGIECSGDGAKTCTFEAPFGSGDNIETLSLQLIDFAGNMANIDAGTVYVDRTPPQIAGDATVIFKKPAGCPLSSVSSITSGSSIDISFIVNEPLKEIGDPLVSAEGEVNIIDFNMTGQIGYFYTFSKSDINTEFLTDGTYNFEIKIEDEVGNKNTILIENGFEIKTSSPASPPVDNPDLIVYRRIPWGSNDSNGIKHFSIISEEGSIDDSAAFVLAYDGIDPATASLIGISPVNKGSFPEMELSRSDRAEVYVAAFDDACNRSEVVKVRDVEWTATLGGKVTGSVWENPHRFLSLPVFKKSLFQDKATAFEPDQEEIEKLAKIDSANLGVVTQSEGFWKEYKLNSDSPEIRNKYSMVYDSARGKVILFGGINENNNYNDMWEWDSENNVWNIISVEGVRPEARSSAAMAYDSKRGKIVLFGGENNEKVFLYDVWEFDCESATWKDRTPHESQSPLPRSSHAMAYDSYRGKVIMTRGAALTVTPLDIWEWDGETGLWTDRTISGTKPGSRAFHTLIYDSDTYKAVMFGGKDPFDKQDIWEWDPKTGEWEDKTPTGTKPSARSGHSMVYDSISKKGYMFGGSTGGNELWRWDGNSGSWTKITVLATQPYARKHIMMAYDLKSDAAIIFGGIDNISGMNLNDTWKWDRLKNRWINVTPDSSKPSPRVKHAMVYDENMKKIILFGGFDGNYKQDTWEWDIFSKKWTDVTPSGTKPDPRASHAMAYDLNSDTILMFGGFDGFPMDGFWRWDTSSLLWTELSDSTPTERWGHTMSFDEATGKMIIFGGNSYGEMNDLWEWNESSGAWVVRFVAGSKPSPRYYHKMAFHKFLGTPFIFGGESWEGSKKDIWDWHGNEGMWADRNIAGDEPGFITEHGMTFDEERESIMLYGGYKGTNVYAKNEVWEWHHLYGWKIRADSGHNPGNRAGHSIVYDTENGVAVLFGGSAGNNSTWEWNGGKDELPAQKIEISFIYAGQNISLIKYAKINVISGATIYGIDNTSESGSKLLLWNKGKWVEVDDNNAGAKKGEPALLAWESEDESELNRIFFGDQKTINFAVTPKNVNGQGTNEVTTDYAEVVVRYRLD